MLFSEIWPDELGFSNRPIKKAELGDLIWKCYKICGHEKTVTMLDKLKELGFREATKAGVSIGIDDMIIPKEKGQEIDTAQKQIKEVEKQYRRGLITSDEQYVKTVELWTAATDEITEAVSKSFAEDSPVRVMANSGATRQTAPVPIIANPTTPSVRWIAATSASPRIRSSRRRVS